jgi:hypothetical protein
MVKDFVKACADCQRNKTEHLHPTALLQPLDVPSMVWSDIAMDFIKGFPRINGKSVVLTVADRFSKSAHFTALGHSYMVTSVAEPSSTPLSTARSSQATFGVNCPRSPESS